ncbi:MAG: thermonuclease family protein [Pseudomonadota bacterium]
MGIAGCATAIALALTLAAVPVPAHADETTKAASPAQSKRAKARKPRKPKPCRWTRTQRAVVAKVISATEFQLDDASRITLAQLVAPRAFDVPGADPGTWPMEDATVARVAKLFLGRNIRIAYLSRRPDRYGRRPAYVWLARTAGSKATGDGQPTSKTKTAAAADWVQRIMLARGLARFDPVRARSACASRLLAAEAEARGTGAGLWALASYRVRSAARPRALLRQSGTFQIVEGRIARAARVRGRVYLNFGRRWRRDFTVRIDKRNQAALAHRLKNLRALSGVRVRVRGYITESGGPLIRLEHAAQIEFLDAPTRSNANIAALGAGSPPQVSGPAQRDGVAIPFVPKPDISRRSHPRKRQRPDVAGPGVLDL